MHRTRTFSFIITILICIILLQTFSQQVQAANIYIVDNSTVPGGQSSVAVNAGKPIISYYDKTNKDLMLAICGDAACTTFTNATRRIDSVGDVGSRSALTVVDGKAVMAYSNLTSGDLKLAVCPDAMCSSPATIQTLDSTGSVGSNPAITLVNGNPFISYSDATNENLKIAACIDPFCESPVIKRTIDSVGSVGITSALEVVNGNPIIAYFDLDNYDVKIAACTDPTCSASTITRLNSTEDVSGDIAITIINGNPLIAFLDQYDGSLATAACSNPTCTTPITITPHSARANPSGRIGLTNVGGVGVIAYSKISDNDLGLATCNDALCTSVTTSVLDSVGSTGGSPAIVNLNNTIGISYYDATNSRIKFYYGGDSLYGQTTTPTPSRTPMSLPVPSATITPIGQYTPDPTSTPIPTSTIPASGISHFIAQYGQYASLALDQNGLPFVSYYAATDLMLARCNNAAACDAPTIMTIATQDQSGYKNALVLDADGIPVIAYGYFPGTGTNAPIILARCNNSTTCDAPTLRTVVPDFYYLSLALTDDGRPVIAYNVSNLSTQHYALGIVVCNDPYCDTYQRKEITQLPQNFMGPVKIALTDDNIPIVAYSYFDTHHQVGLALCDNSTCDSPFFRIIDAAETDNSLGDLMLDPQDNPIVAYSTDTHLKLLRCNDHTTCESPTYTELDTNALGGSLDFDSDGVIFASYIKLPEEDLMLVACENALDCNTPLHSVLVSDGTISNQLSLKMNGHQPVIRYFNYTNSSLMLYMGSEIIRVTSTPIPTDTPIPTETPIPTDTPIPTNTPLPTATSTPVMPTSPPNATLGRDFFITDAPTLTWNSVSWAIGYQIQIDDDPNFGSPVLVPAEFASDVLSYTTPALSNGTYYWHVRARRDAVNWGDWSSMQSFVISSG